ncbi:MAG: tripartite tricarboxylate transporter TctB family protein [Hyphomicrobiales bacterium]|nr:tripartite tricarboxylate transporter TctB family protein [Hyphomicrobiales bacterium]
MHSGTGVGHALGSKDFLAGLLFIAFGLTGLWLGRALESGSASAMESGYFPRLVCALLIAIGVLLATTALVRPNERPEPGTWRPITLVTASCLAFALLLKPLGLIVTLVVTTVLARSADRGLRLLPLLTLALLLTVATVGIFVLALRLAIPLWPSVL